jgi:hypothetical protein
VLGHVGMCVAGVAICVEEWPGPLLPGGETGDIKVFAYSVGVRGGILK